MHTATILPANSLRKAKIGDLLPSSLRETEAARMEKAGLDPSAADNITVKVFDGELSEQGKKNLANVSLNGLEPIRF